MQSRRMAAGVLLALVVAFGAGVYAGVSERGATAAGLQLFVTSESGSSSSVDMSAFWRAWDLLERNFVQTHGSSTPSEEEKVYGAIEGLAESFGDPYTVFLPPQEAKQFADDISGVFSGVGMELGARGGVLTVVAPLKGTPAEAAGIRTGDIILSIDDEPSREMAVDAAVKRIRGPKGTMVELVIEREGEAQPIKLSIVRDTINIPIVNAYARPDGIFVIELYSFSQNSSALFRQALRQYFESDANKLLLDLRGNPGGYLEASVDMASYFLPMGATIVTEDFGGKQSNVVHRSVGYNVFAGRPIRMAILINEGSASASEILAGALQQHGLAKLVGEPTFGKGSVQQLMDLGGGAQLKVTVARWLTPNGDSISDGGLTPDIEASRTQEDVSAGLDPQKEAAVNYLLGR